MAEGEVRNGFGELLTIRQAIVKERILRAIELPENPVVPRGLADVIEASPLIRAVRDCMPDLNVFSPLSIEQKVENLLVKASKLEAERGKNE
jgi:hypothetical protein